MLVDCSLYFLLSESKDYFVVMSLNDLGILIPWRRIRDAEEGSCLEKKTYCIEKLLFRSVFQVQVELSSW